MKRRRKKASTDGKSIKLYFHSGTQAAIERYQVSDDKKERDELYVKEIMPAFSKLVENLINIHKFSGLHDTYDELKNDCCNFLFETIKKFDASRGTNAFSYFNVVAKNWLIIKTKQRNQKSKKSLSLDDPDLSLNDQKLVEQQNIVPSQESMIANKKSLSDIVNVLYEIRSKVKTTNELSCINAVITMFENIDEIDLLNKGAVLLYIRELSGLNSKQLTTTMQSLKRLYKSFKIENFDIFGI